MATATCPRGDVVSTTTRITKEGRKLKYSLTVIQQPERARACGSGAKSSADRRPVDPPPVVELRIFEVIDEAKDKKEDITFSYDANFFLFATLETARPMAHGRVHPAPPQIPVLTGMPVSGMAYLDRPSEAGYFIFPDLSVRHEGKYVLSFNLYEETKKPQTDGDAEPASDQNKPKVPPVPGAPESSFDFRMEVKSNMFTVFSAKKFPGLAESTPLSRTVAEQGCRVRIRRDVRMRRRDKAPSEYDDSNAVEDGYARHGRPSEQANEPYRERSNSAVSEDGRSRRLSGEYPQGYPGYSPSPIDGHPPPGGHLNFGPPPGSQYPAPQGQFAQPPPPPPPAAAPRQPYQSGPAPYPPPSQYRPAPLPPAPQAGFPYERPYPQSAYPSNPPREQRDPYEPEQYRRGSAGFPAPNPPHGAPYPAVDAGFGRPPYHALPRPHTPPPPSPVNLAPLKSLPPIEAKLDSLSSPPGPLSSVHRIAPPLPSPAFERHHERSETYGQYSIPVPAVSEQTRSGKRAYDSAFNSSNNQPLYNGARPSSSHHESSGFEQDDGQDASDSVVLQYRRADGSNNIRPQPPMV